MVEYKTLTDQAPDIARQSLTELHNLEDSFVKEKKPFCRGCAKTKLTNTQTEIEQNALATGHKDFTKLKQAFSELVEFGNVSKFVCYAQKNAVQKGIVMQKEMRVSRTQDIGVWREYMCKKCGNRFSINIPAEEIATFKDPIEEWSVQHTSEVEAVVNNFKAKYGKRADWVFKLIPWRTVSETHSKIKK